MLRELHGRLILLGGLLLPGIGATQEVSGVVRDVEGPGLRNIVVRASVYDSIGFTQFVATTDVSGTFGFPAREGSWYVATDTPGLNAIGYFSAGSASLSVSNEARALRFTTRKLDLSRRVTGVLRDDWQAPLSGIAFRAFIEENRQSYETNVVTGVDGSFLFRASPAVWRLPLSGAWTPPLLIFPDVTVPVEITDIEKQVTLIAPRATANIFGVASNLAGYEIVAECEAYGARYLQTAQLWRSVEPFSLPVFNGVWKVRATNSYVGSRNDLLPAPIIVNVTNQSVEVRFMPPASVLERNLEVHVVTMAGVPVTNASVYAYNMDDFRLSASPAPPSPFPGQSGTVLRLRSGRWRVSATVTGSQLGASWYVTREFVMTEGGVSNLTLVVPADDIGPRIAGVAHRVSGELLAGRQVSFRAREQETNYTRFGFTDTNGAFSVGVLPGRWSVTVSDSTPCPASAIVTVSDSDQEIDLVVCPPPTRTGGPIQATVADEGGPPDMSFGVTFSNWPNYFQTNGSPDHPLLVPLSFGLWNASLSADWSAFVDDPYRLFPSVRFLYDEAGPTNLVLVGRQSRSRLEVRLRDAQGQLVRAGYAFARANVGGTNYSAVGQMGSGYISLNLIPGDWEVAVSTWRYPSFGIGVPIAPGASPSLEYVDPVPRFVQVTNGLNVCEFSVNAFPVTVPLTAVVVREDGSSVDGAAVQISGELPAGLPVAGSPGMALFNVIPGTNVVAAWQSETPVSERLLFPSVALNCPASTSNHVTLVVRAPSGCMRGAVVDSSGRPLNVPVVAWNVVNGTNYFSNACPGPDQEYCLPVFPGEWQIIVQEELANGLGFQSTPPQRVTVPVSGHVLGFDFVLKPLTADFRSIRLSNPGLTPGGRMQLELRAQASLTWTIEGSEDLEKWVTLFRITTANGTARFSDPGTPLGRSRFYRAKWVE